MLLSAGGSVPESLCGDTTNGIYADQERGIFIMAHGVSEGVKSETAIPVAFQIICARLERETGSVDERVREALTLANNELYDLSPSPETDRATTCLIAASVINNMEAIIGQVGDAHLYQLKPDSISMLTSEAERDSAHAGTETSAVMTNRVGSRKHEPEDKDFIEMIKIPFEPESALLLCSNNLGQLISAPDMLRIIRQQPGNRTRVVRALIAAAHEADSRERLSVLFIEGEKFARALRRRNRDALRTTL